VRPEEVSLLEKNGLLRPRQLDKERVKSMIASAEVTAKVAQAVPLTDESATLIFREVYESVRQLGDAEWWLRGFEPRTHDVSLDVLKDMAVTNRLRLNHLSRFKGIRHDINYRGFRATVEQAKEIVEFWNTCGEELLAQVKEKVFQ